MVEDRLMRLGFIPRRSGRLWRSAFAFLIAIPALVLALLGMRVARLESLERAQEVRQQQAQLARLADTTVATMLAALQGELARTGASHAIPQTYTVFALEPGGRLMFPQDKTYFPDPGKTETPRYCSNVPRLPISRRQARRLRCFSKSGGLSRACEPGLNWLWRAGNSNQAIPARSPI